MTVELTIADLERPDQPYRRIFMQEKVVIGRARSCDICLPDLTVSLRHAEIRLGEQGGYVLVDLDSVNGTRIDDQELIAHRPKRLADCQPFRIARFVLTFKRGAQAPMEPKDTAIRQARSLLANILGAQGHTLAPPTLAIVSSPGRTGRFTLPGPGSTIVLGRGAECEIVVDDPDASRLHADISIEPGSLILADRESRNGVFVGGQRLEGPVTLAPGDQFSIGQSLLALEHPADDELHSIWETPEEQTASMSLESATTLIENARAEKEDAAPVESNGDLPPIGPADPLITPPDEQTARSTPPQQNRPTHAPSNNNDTGLIIVGGIIVLATVIALIYFFS